MMIDQLTAERVLYPLRFVPICQYRLWGGRRLAEWLNAPMPDHGSIGEPRPLQVEQALACIDFDQKEIGPPCLSWNPNLRHCEKDRLPVITDPPLTTTLQKINKRTQGMDALSEFYLSYPANSLTGNNLEPSNHENQPRTRTHPHQFRFRHSRRDGGRGA